MASSVSTWKGWKQMCTKCDFHYTMQVCCKLGFWRWLGADFPSKQRLSILLGMLVRTKKKWSQHGAATETTSMVLYSLWRSPSLWITGCWVCMKQSTLQRKSSLSSLNFILLIHKQKGRQLTAGLHETWRVVKVCAVIFRRLQSSQTENANVQVIVLFFRIASNSFLVCLMPRYETNMGTEPALALPDLQTKETPRKPSLIRTRDTLIERKTIQALIIDVIFKTVLGDA